MAPICCCFDQTAVWHSDAARGPSTPSLDHLVGAGEQAIRHREAERLRGPEIEHELELGRLHDWQVSGIVALENTPDVESSLTVGIRNVIAIAHQPPLNDKFTIGVHVRDRVTSR